MDDDYAFLRAAVSNYINRVPYWPNEKSKDVSIFIIQLRNPDYWIILACTTERPETSVLFNGNWNDAIDFFSQPPDSFPDPTFLSFRTHRRESTLLEMSRDALKSAIMDLTEYLLVGNDSMIIFTAGVQIFKHPGVLEKSHPLYFEHYLDETGGKSRELQTIFQGYSHERKALLCGFPIIQGAGPLSEEFRTRIRRELYRDQFSTDTTVKREFMSEDVRLYVFGNGFLIGDSRHKPKALEAMNTFLAYCFVRGIGTSPTGIQDTGTVTIKPNGSTSQWSWGPSRPQNGRLLDPSIEIGTLDKIITDFTQELTTELALDLRLFHQSAFHYMAGEHLQAFTLAWIVVERSVSSLWHATLTARDYTDSRLKELCSSDRYTMSVMIDMLELTSVLEKNAADLLHSIRRVRNKASHEGRIPSNEDVAKALSLAVNYIKATSTKLDIDSEKVLGRIGATV